MIKKRQIIFRLILLLSCCRAAGQSDNAAFFKNASLGVQGYYGSFLTTLPKAVYIRDSYSSFLEIYFQKQTDGHADWQVTHKLPQWGVSFLFGNTGSRQYIGDMAALYFYINLPLIKTPVYLFSFRFGAGPGIVQKPYDINSNPKNTLIGTRLNAYISMQFRNEFQLGKQLSINAGLGFTHLSNGGTTLPNLGLNTPVVSTGLRYSPAKLVMVTRVGLPIFRQQIIYRLSLSTGLKQMQWVGGKYNLISVLQGDITKRFSPNNGFGGGFALYYDPFSQQNNTSGIMNNEATPTLRSGIYGAYEQFLGKFSIPFQLGFYVNRLKGSPVSFQQIGLRFQASTRVHALLYLKTHLGKADFIHAGVGYTW